MDRTSAPGHLNRMFVREDAATNRPPTELVPEDFNAWQEEIMAVIEAGGIMPDKAVLNQLKQALDALYCARKSIFLPVSVNTVLTSADTGKIIEYIGAGSISLTLPAPGGNAGLHYRIENRSSAGGIVTLNTPSGAIYYYTNSATSMSIATSYGLEVYSDGNNWVIKSAEHQPSRLGVDQNKVNMTAQRAKGAWYTNSTGRPIAINYTCSMSAFGRMSLWVGTEEHLSSQGFAAGAIVSEGDIVIPAGAQYGIFDSVGVNTLLKVIETR